ncbi:MAG: phage major capsid protein [Alphaproteobacteria bacterium]|nr:MAG: phage major capsid protein [Alphaproteobacteria bacterium]
MATPSTVFTEMVTASLRHVASELADNVSKHNALLNIMKRKGKFQSIDGGYEIQMPLEYAENGTYQRYAGYEQLNTAASDVLTSAKYDWKQAAVHVTASGREIRQNTGDAQIINLVKTRIKNAVKTAANNLSVDIFSDGTLANQIGGLAHIVTSDGTGTVGGIDASVFPFWKNKFREIPGTDAYTSATFKNEMNALWLSCVRGTDNPDVIVMSHDFYSTYEAGLQDRARYADVNTAQDGFITLKYKGADVIFDDNANFATTAETAYFLNTNYIYMIQHRDAQFSPDDAKKPVNQDAIVVPLYWMGNLVCTNRALQGKLIDAS